MLTFYKRYHAGEARQFTLRLDIAEGKKSRLTAPPKRCSTIKLQVEIRVSQINASA
jgi:hypothetical protein